MIEESARVLEGVKVLHHLSLHDLTVPQRDPAHGVLIIEWKNSAAASAWRDSYFFSNRSKAHIETVSTRASSSKRISSSGESSNIEWDRPLDVLVSLRRVNMLVVGGMELTFSMTSSLSCLISALEQLAEKHQRGLKPKYDVDSLRRV